MEFTYNDFIGYSYDTTGVPYKDSTKTNSQKYSVDTAMVVKTL
jgi:hypothetical protein